MRNPSSEDVTAWRKTRAAVDAVKAVGPAFAAAARDFEGAVDAEVKRAAFRRLRRLHKRATGARRVLDKGGHGK